MVNDGFKFVENNNDAVEILVIADRSGSMYSIEKDAIGGFNSFLKEQQEMEGEANLTLVLFNHDYDVKLESVPIREVKQIESLGATGSTAMNDAIGKALSGLFNRNPKRAIVCILTDGEENSSTEYTNSSVKELIQRAENEKEWKVVFLAANQDAFAEGSVRGISNNFNFEATSKGISSAYADTMNYNVRSYRQAS